MSRLFRFAWLPALLALVAGTPTGAAAYDLTPIAKPNQVYQVEVTLRVGGKLVVRDNLSTRQSDDQEQDASLLPTSVEGSLSYEEQQVSDAMVSRYYTDAHATIKVGSGAKQPELPEDRRLVVGQLEPGARAVLRSPQGPLTREQLDLIDVTGASYVVDGMLPREKKADSESWQVGAEVMGPLLGLDSVEICEVSNVVDEGGEGYVKFQVAGTVHGKVDGATTEFDVRGLGLFDRVEGCVTRLNLAIKEKRELGPATPGFTGVAKVNIKRTPIDTPEGLTADRLANASRSDAPAADLLLESRDLGLRMLHDREWFVASTSRQSISLRRVDENGLVAQATLTRMPWKKAENLPDLDRFEREVAASLGDSLAEMVGSQQWTSPAGFRCLSAVARSRVDDLEVEQRHYLVMPEEQGHSIAITTTLAVSDMAAVGAADRLLADGLVLLAEEKKQVAHARDDSVAK